MLRSAPPQNVSLPEVITAPLMAASVVTLSTIDESSWPTLASMTVIERPGMFQVTSAMPSASMSRVKFCKVIFSSLYRHPRPFVCQAPKDNALRIRFPVLVRITLAFFVGDRHQIDIGIFGALVLRARPDFKIERVLRALVDEMMPVAIVGFEACGIARLEHRLAAILDQHDFALKDIDELVFLLMPVTQGRGGAGLECREIDAELVEPGGKAEPLARTAGDHLAERLRVVGAVIHPKLGDIDFRHAARSPLHPSRRARRGTITPAR